MKLTYDPRRNIGYLRFHEKSAEVETVHRILHRKEAYD
jgi:uncharacterized protein YuzE